MSSKETTTKRYGWKYSIDHILGFESRQLFNQYRLNIPPEIIALIDDYLFREDWKFNRCGVPRCVNADGKTFESSNRDCIARVDIPMLKDQGEYAIEVKVEQLGNDTYPNFVGIVTDKMDLSDSWDVNFPYFMGWAVNSSKCSDQNIIWGSSRTSDNIFAQACQKHNGDHLPQLGDGDICELILDTTHQILRFKRNGKQCETYITGIPMDDPLYFAAGRYYGHFKATIL